MIAVLHLTVVSSNPAHGDVYSKLVSDLRQVTGFLHK